MMILLGTFSLKFLLQSLQHPIKQNKITYHNMVTTIRADVILTARGDYVCLRICFKI